MTGYMGLAVGLNDDSDVNGSIRITGGNYFSLGTSVTTAPTTGMQKGDLFIHFSTSSPQMGICTSTAAQTVKYISLFDTKTLGRAT